MPSVRSRKSNRSRVKHPKMSGWLSGSGLFQWVKSVILGSDDTLELEYKSDIPWHGEMAELFYDYFTRITPMFELNPSGTIRMVEYPADYKTFLEEHIIGNLMASNFYEDEIFDQIPMIKGYLLEREQVDRVWNTIKSSKSTLTKIISATSINPDNEEYTYYTLKAGIMDEGCKRRFNHLMSVRYNLIISSMTGNINTFSEGVFKGYEKNLRLASTKDLDQYKVFWFSEDSLARRAVIRDEFLRLGVAESETVDAIAEFYKSLISIEMQNESINNFINNEVKEEVRKIDVRYLALFDKYIAGVNIDKYKLTNFRNQYRIELANYISRRAALELIHAKFASLTSNNYNLTLLGLDTDFVEQRFLNIHEFDLSFIQSTATFLVAERLLHYLKKTPKEITEFKFHVPIHIEERNKFAQRWRTLHTIFGKKNSIDAIKAGIDRLFNKPDYFLSNKLDFSLLLPPLVDFLNLAIYLTNENSNPSVVAPKKSKGYPSYIPTSVASSSTSFVPTPSKYTPPAIASSSTGVAAPQSNAPIQPRTVVVTTPFIDFFVKGIDVKKIRDDPNFISTMQTFGQRSYPRIVKLWYRWIKGDARIAYAGKDYTEYSLFNELVSNLSMANIYNDPAYYNIYLGMVEAFKLSGSRFFDSYSPDEIPLAIEEMRLSIFNNLPIDRELVLWRGLKNLSVEAFNTLCIGVSINQVKRFTKLSAASFNVDVACRTFANSSLGNTVLIKIIVPRGMRILNLNVISSKLNNEAEVIIPDNTYFQVVNIESHAVCSSTTCKKLITLKVVSQWNVRMNRFEPQIDTSSGDISIL